MAVSTGGNRIPLRGEGCYPAYAACNVYGRNGTRFLSMVKHRKGADPFLTQKGGTFDFMSFELS